MVSQKKKKKKKKKLLREMDENIESQNVFVTQKMHLSKCILKISDRDLTLGYQRLHLVYEAKSLTEV